MSETRPPTRFLRSKEARKSVAPPNKRRTKRKWRHTALKEIQKVQSGKLATELLIPHSRFRLLVAELASELKLDARFTKIAMEAIQEAAEAHLLALFEGMSIVLMTSFFFRVLFAC